MLFTSLPYHAFVTLPLLVLASHFTFLWPVAAANLLAAIGVCVVASAQADLPKKKQRVWSRPLIAMLFLLQPIVRGWSRYKWAWSERTQPHYQNVGSPSPGSTPSPLSGERSGVKGEALPIASPSNEQTLSYWSDGALDRYAFLKRIIARLEAEKWRIKLDTGYNDYDLEIAGSNWARLRLTTVTEELDAGRRVFRCRIKSSWTFRSQALFWLCLATALAIVGLLAPIEPWLWMLPATLPILDLFLNGEKRRTQQLLTALLDRSASEQRLVKLSNSAGDEVTSL
jgi:hypothetical protein